MEIERQRALAELERREVCVCVCHPNPSPPHPHIVLWAVCVCVISLCGRIRFVVASCVGPSSSSTMRWKAMRTRTHTCIDTQPLLAGPLAPKGRGLPQPRSPWMKSQYVL
jgi:hypothetical protein